MSSQLLDDDTQERLREPTGSMNDPRMLQIPGVQL
jgi:hypothetical protein